MTGLESMCDNCSTPLATSDAQTCEYCGMTCCERCIGVADHDCEGEE